MTMIRLPFQGTKNNNIPLRYNGSAGMDIAEHHNAALKENFLPGAQIPFVKSSLRPVNLHQYLIKLLFVALFPLRKDGTLVYRNEPSVYNEITMFSPAQWQAVQLGMYNVVNTTTPLRVIVNSLGIKREVVTDLVIKIVAGMLDCACHIDRTVGARIFPAESQTATLSERQSVTTITLRRYRSQNISRPWRTAASATT